MEPKFMNQNLLENTVDKTISTAKRESLDEQIEVTFSAAK